MTINLGMNTKKGLKKENVNFFYTKKKENIPTGTCLIPLLLTRKEQCALFFGVAGKINKQDIDINAIKNSEILFLEGYLWDKGEPKEAFIKAIKNSKKNCDVPLRYFLR